MKTNAWIRAAAAALLAATIVDAAAAFQQPPPRRGRRNGGQGPGVAPPAGEAPTVARKASDGKVTAIVGADVVTVTREVVRRGTVLIQDGKILRVGQDIEVPANATKIDGTGKYLTPGFIAMSMRSVASRAGGIGPGGGLGGPGGGRNSRIADTLDPYDRNIKFCLAAGITTGVAEVMNFGAGRFGRNVEDDENRWQVCPCCGLAILPTEPLVPPTPGPTNPQQHAVLKLSYGDLEPMLVKDSPFYHINASALTGQLNRYNWRESLRKAKKYVQEVADYERDVRAGKQARQPQKTVADELIALVKREKTLRIDASSATQIRDMISLAKEFEYLLLLDGVQEGWLAADDLANAKVQVVLTPRNRRRPQPGREDNSGSSIETAGVFDRAGVPFAIAALSPQVSLDGIAGRDLQSLPLEAAFAIRGGAREKTALEALTIVPARMLGLADRLGSIEEGKDADLLLLDGPPLDYRTYVETAFIEGKVYYERLKDKVVPGPRS